jgi:hypothetical protein
MSSKEIASKSSGDGTTYGMVSSSGGFSFLVYVSGTWHASISSQLAFLCCAHVMWVLFSVCIWKAFIAQTRKRWSRTY